MRRVVVTGLGIVSPLGLGVEHVWSRLVRGESGVGTINAFNSASLACQVAGQIPLGSRAENRLDLDEWLSGDQQRHMGRFSQFAMIAAMQAVEHAGWQPSGLDAQFATGVCIGSGCGGMEAHHDAARTLIEASPTQISDGFLRCALIHQAAVDLGDHFSFLGPRRAFSTACASGAHAIGDAARMIMFGDADVMLAGGTDAAVHEISLAGFCAARALSTGFNATPAQASRPWDKDRDGFVMAEGAGVLVLEERDHAIRRGATIIAELAGYGLSGDAHHVTAPADGHDGALRAMRSALRNAKLHASDIHYINAHGTSTPLGDDLELEAVETLFGAAANDVVMSSTKSATGHLLGAAGAVEAIFSILAIRDGVAPPTLNLHNPSRRSRIDRVAHVAQERRIRAALSNSFGFGGTNASIVFKAAA